VLLMFAVEQKCLGTPKYWKSSWNGVTVGKVPERFKKWQCCHCCPLIGEIEIKIAWVLQTRCTHCWVKIAVHNKCETCLIWRVLSSELQNHVIHWKSTGVGAKWLLCLQGWRVRQARNQCEAESK
jgi:hypothetical protein